MSHTPEEVDAFLSRSHTVEQLKIARARADKGRRLVLDFLVDINASVHVVERPTFRRLADFYGMKFPASRKGFSNLSTTEAESV